MSNPVTNAEVEDVLSSIRRLVSEDMRPLQIKQTAPANDRLVLTPALRVAKVADDEGNLEASGNDDSDLDALDVDDGEQDALKDDKADSDFKDVEFKHDSAGAISKQDEEANFDYPAHNSEADPHNFSDDDDEDGEGNETLEATSLDVDDDDNDSRVDVPAETKTNAIETGSARAATLSAKMEALETAIGKIAETWEPDEPGSDEYSGTEDAAMAWEDDDDRDAMAASLDIDEGGDDLDPDEEFAGQTAAPSATPQAESAPQPTAMSEQPSQHDAPNEDSFAYGNDDQMIDEEALRDLVSDIVRAELQGALGERITRNVRKLVRREIHRALTAQELE